MNALAGLLSSAPTGALNLTSQTAKAAASPFQMLLEAMQGSGSTEDATAGESAADEAGTLQERLARQLQDLLESLGVQAGDQVTLSVSESGDILADGHPLANEIESAINDDPELKSDLQQLSANEGLFDQSPFFGDARLEVEVAEGADAANLSWI